MSKHSVKGVIKVLGIDLAKNSFQLHGVDKNGQVVLKKNSVVSNSLLSISALICFVKIEVSIMSI